MTIMKLKKKKNSWCYPEYWKIKLFLVHWWFLLFMRSSEWIRMNVKISFWEGCLSWQIFFFPFGGGGGWGSFSEASDIFGIHILWRAHLNHRPQHMAGRQVIRNREDKIGFWNFLPSWYTFRTFCLRSQFFLVQNQIVEIQYFHIILREMSNSTWIQQTRKKALNLSDH